MIKLCFIVVGIRVYLHLWFVGLNNCDCDSYGLLTLHESGTEKGTGNRNVTGGFCMEMLTLVQEEERKLDQLFPIVLVQFPVPVLIPFPCSVNKPLLVD